MATRPRFQRQGIGRAVLDTAMRDYLDGDVTTFIREAAAAGVRLSEEVGFKTVGSVIGLRHRQLNQFST